MNENDVLRLSQLYGLTYFTDIAQIEYPVASKEERLKHVGDITGIALLTNNTILLADQAKDSLRLCVSLSKKIPNSVIALTTQSILDNLLMMSSNEGELTPSVQNVEIEERSKTQLFLDSLIKRAVDTGASDIHFVTDEVNGAVSLKFRKLGKLVPVTLPMNLTPTLVHSMGGLIVSHESHRSGGSSQEEFNEKNPNAASCMINSESGIVSIRYNHQPIASPKGLDIAMRIHSLQAKSTPTFASLGYSSYEQLLQEKAFSFSHGLVIYTGPTGSGKSTALAAGISLLSTDLKKISYEDPIETNLLGVEQVQVNSKNPKTTFAAYSRVVLRQDPDVVIYGEIRDAEVMKEAKSQANTGHLVLSTLHANGAIETLTRMHELGVSYNDLATRGLIRALIAQRLVPKVCPACSVSLGDIVSTKLVKPEHLRLHAYFEEHHPSSLNTIKVKGDGKKLICRMPMAMIVFAMKISIKIRKSVRVIILRSWLLLERYHHNGVFI